MKINWDFELTNVALLIGAIVAAIYAHRQVIVMRENNQKQAESAKNQELQLRATVLLTLDQRWESDPVLKIRSRLEDLWTAVMTEVRRDHPEPGAAVQFLSAPYFARRLKEMHTIDSDTQRQLLQICGFFETVGYVTKAKYITLDDVYQLLGGSIMTAGLVFKPYIEELLREGAHPRIYQNFLWLIDQIRRRDAIS